MVVGSCRQVLSKICVFSWSFEVILIEIFYKVVGWPVALLRKMSEKYSCHVPEACNFIKKETHR